MILSLTYPTINIRQPSFCCKCWNNCEMQLLIKHCLQSTSSLRPCVQFQWLFFTAHHQTCLYIGLRQDALKWCTLVKDAAEQASMVLFHYVVSPTTLLRCYSSYWCFLESPVASVDLWHQLYWKWAKTRGLPTQWHYWSLVSAKRSCFTDMPEWVPRTCQLHTSYRDRPLWN